MRDHLILGLSDLYLNLSFRVYLVLEIDQITLVILLFSYF